MVDRVKFVGVNSITFNQKFKTDQDCLQYLSSLKWEKGYRCKKCKNDRYCPGKKPDNRRCTKCGYEESPTAATMFDKVKFSLLKAFHIAFKISTKKKGMSSLELSHEFELRQKTCWEFKWKVQQAMASSLQYPLEGTIHVDEFMIGGARRTKTGQEQGLKKTIGCSIRSFRVWGWRWKSLCRSDRACLLAGTGQIFKEVCFERGEGCFG